MSKAITKRIEALEAEQPPAGASLQVFKYPAGVRSPQPGVFNHDMVIAALVAIAVEQSSNEQSPNTQA
jgi:hypothetical protein